MDQILLPKYINIGGGAVKKINDILDSLNCSRPIIITDKVIINLGLLETLEKELTSMQTIYKVFSDTIPEPTARSIEKGVVEIKNGDYDCIIAFGGGSPIDSAKAISILAKYGGNINSIQPNTCLQPTQ